MTTDTPSRPQTIDELDLLIKNKQWSIAWERNPLELSEKYACLWLRLAIEIWEIAFLDEAEQEHDSDKNTEENDDSSCNYSSDIQIARILIGFPSSCESTPKPLEQDDFAQITCAACTKPDDSISVRRDIRLIYLKIVHQGKKSALWDLCVPSYPVLIKRSTPRIQLNNLNYLHQARKVRHALIDTIKTCPAWFNEFRETFCILSAIFWGGLIEKAAIEALSTSINEPLKSSAGGIWIDLTLNPDTPIRKRIRRFWPDPITTSLWLTLENSTGNKDKHFNNIPIVLEKVLGEKPPPLSILIKGISQEISLEIPEVLVHIATGQTITNPIKLDRWCGIQHAELPEQNTQPEQSNNNEGEPDLDNINITSDIENDPLLDLVSPPGMNLLREAIRNNNIKNMKSHLELVVKNRSDYPHIIFHLANWMINLPGKPRLSTIKWMFGLIGARLVSLCEDDDPAIYDDDEIENIFYNIIEDGQSASHKRGMRHALTSFYKYLFKDQEPIRPSILKELDTIEVSSRIITHDEYQIALETLSKPTFSNDDPQWLEICQILLILFFKLGFRRRELFLLPLHDIHGNQQIEILIRPHRERELKTTNALRALLLNGFLSEIELDAVRKWLTKRRSEETIDSQSPYLFAIPNNGINLISESTVIKRIVDTIRTVTNDPEIHIHHLRHSFASWSSISLIGNTVEEDFASWKHLPVTQDWLKSFPSTIYNLYPKAPLQHSLIYQISTILGHSTPAISMEHYIHGLDQILGNAIWRYFSVEPSDVGCKYLNIPLRTFQRWSKVGWSEITNKLINEYPNHCHLLKYASQQTKSCDYISDISFSNYHQIWGLLKTIDNKKLSISDPALTSVYPSYQLEMWTSNSALINTKGLSKNLYPYLPHGKNRIPLIKKYVCMLDKLSKSENGLEIINKLTKLWITHKIRNRGALLFKNPKDARDLLDILLFVGIKWKNISLVWVGSRFTEPLSRKYRTYWRNELNLSRRISIGIKSINNNRPLSKTKGYMEISVQNDDEPTTSKEFNWVLLMSFIVLAPE